MIIYDFTKNPINATGGNGGGRAPKNFELYPSPLSLSLFVLDISDSPANKVS
jgi:hypothetical protein